MSETMPPGWYPDPGHSGQGTVPERWWDGTRWTDEVRADAPEGPTDPGAGEPPAAGTARRRRRRAVLAAAALLAAAVAVGTVPLFTSGADPEVPATDRQPAPSGGPPSGDATTDPAEGDQRPPAPPALTEAAVSGAVLPVYPGWTELAYPPGAAVTTGGYPCPRDPDRDCALGGAFLTVSDSDNVYPRPVAEVDIAEHTDLSYSEETYGGVVAHREEMAEEITVAGQDGFRVRRWVETGTGAEAYAESVAFPAPDGSGRLLILRLGWVAGGEAPGEADIEQLVAAVQRAPSTGAGTGV